MNGRLRLLAVSTFCLILAGCSGGDDDQQNQALKAAGAPNNAPRNNFQDDGGNARPAAKPKPKQEASVAKKSGGPIMGYLPASLTVAVGANTEKLSEISAATGTNFLSEMRPVTELILKAGITTEEIQELWVGSNSQSGEKAVCARTKKPYDREKINAGLQVAQNLGKIDGSEVYSLPSGADGENAIAFIDDQTFIVGRRSAVEASLKRTDIPQEMQKLLEQNIPGYMVRGDSETYLQQLAHHGFPEFAAYSEELAPPREFALMIQMNFPQLLQQNLKLSQSQIPGPNAQKKPPIPESVDEELLEHSHNDSDPSRTQQNSAPAVSAARKPVAMLITFQYEDERPALDMERRAKEILKNMKARLEAEANLDATLAKANQPPPVRRPGGAPGRRPGGAGGLGEDEHDQIDEETLPGQWLRQQLTSDGLRLQTDDDEEEERSKRAFNPGANRPGIGVGNVYPRRPVAVNFKYNVNRLGSILIIAVTLDLKPEMTSVVATVLRAMGNSLEGDSIFRGNFPTLLGALSAWRDGQQGRIPGVRKVPGQSIVAGYSWMTELLPYLGHQNVYVGFDFKKNWVTDPNNRRLAGTVVPEFLDPAAQNAKWKGYPFDGLGISHFVGMAGVEDGPNVVAAALDRSDPRAGVFGYDAVAAPRHITDGTGTTIMMIGSGHLAGPWVQGGGATIRGARAPYFDKISGFGSPGMKSPGARVLFVDGSSREISADIDPAVFRALCTIHGGETVDLKPAASPAEQTTAVDSADKN